ncbi:uncharacterized protein LOC127851102 [Dreissena polymorpha]|uniref:uncharacterized protein LOC127851102 n=1 Tax=Dreissena polymorpha TaxID=45954 RepID=UPI0022647979|nr:uncharacterized protein LOC127851102 [Dreissena polymorpha]
MMDGDNPKTHGNQGLSHSLQNNGAINLPVSSFISQPGSSHGDIQTIILQIQQMLEMLSGRGVNSMLVTVDCMGDISIQGSNRGQIFLKENPDIADRFSKICSDDVWTLLGAQKRFLEIGRQQAGNKSGFSEKGDYPLDFSHERGSYFPSQSVPTSAVQENSFVQGILSQTNHKSYQPNTLFQGPFGQFVNENRANSGSFFQGGFSQSVQSSDNYVQSSYMSGADSINNKDSFVNQPLHQPMPGSLSSHQNQQDKSNGMSEAELIKEMLSATPVTEVVLNVKTNTGSNKEKSTKNKAAASSEAEKSKEGSAKKKRERRPETWQRNIKKKLKTEGKAYVNAKGKLVPAKEMRPVDCSKCKQRCTDKISEDTRKKIFDWFWKLGSYTAQKEFVVSRVTQVATRTNKRRSVHRLFSFEINGKYESVCKPFFSGTLGIGDSYIYKAFEQKARDLFVQDGRGKHAPVNKTSQEQVEVMHAHLDRHLSEYSTDKALPKNIHAVKWYEEYLALCASHDKKPVSKHIYRKIFQEYTRKFPNPTEKKKTDIDGDDPAVGLSQALVSVSRETLAAINGQIGLSQ